MFLLLLAILELDHLALGGGDAEHEVVLLLLQVGALLLDDNAEELVLETLLLDGKVDNGRLGADLGGVVGGGELRSGQNK